MRRAGRALVTVAGLTVGHRARAGGRLRRAELGPRPTCGGTRSALGPATLHVHRTRRHARAPARRGCARRSRADRATARHVRVAAHLGRLGRCARGGATRDPLRPAGVRTDRTHAGRRLPDRALRRVRGGDARRARHRALRARRQLVRRHRRLAGDARVAAGSRAAADPGRRGGLPAGFGIRADRVPDRSRPAAVLADGRDVASTPGGVERAQRVR